MFYILVVWLVSYIVCVLKKLKKFFDLDLLYLLLFVYGFLFSVVFIRIFDMIKLVVGDKNIIRLLIWIINLDLDLVLLLEYVVLFYMWGNLIMIWELVLDLMNFRNFFFCFIKGLNNEWFGWLDLVKWIYFW